MKYSIKVYKQYFNFASSHFLIFDDGTREPLHGHNYRVMVKGDAPELKADMVFDFLDIKPIVRQVCDSLDHKLLLPAENIHLEIESKDQNFNLKLKDGSFFSIPKSDTLVLPLPNISAERLAMYLSEEIKAKTFEKFQFTFSNLEVEVEETPGQSAVYINKDSL